MVARGASPFRSANAGELSPDAAGRVDVKQFYSAGLRFKNIEPVPLSGFRRMAGSFDEGEVRGQVVPLSVTGVVVNAVPLSGTQVIWQGTVTGDICAIDCSALDAVNAVHSLQAQVFSAGVWVNLGQPISVGTAPRAMTMAVKPGGGIPATQARLLATFSALDTITAGTVTVLADNLTQNNPRYTSVKHDSGIVYDISVQANFLDIFVDSNFVGGCYLPTLGSSILPYINFYSEDATIGIAQYDLETLRVRRGASSYEWVRDFWPYQDIPGVDLGGAYSKTNDVWEVQIKYTGTPYVYVSFTVEGESTPGVPFTDGAGVAVAIASANLVYTAAAMKAALEALPSLGATVTVVIVALAGSAYKITLTFGGNLSGAEYQVTTIVTNTADAAALASHIQIGKTELEPIFSDERGWPGVFGFAQDRLEYGDIKAVPSAISLSAAGEYFNINIEAAGASGARLDKLRGQTSERVLAFSEATYPLVLTDRAVHFASNRSISKTEPLNFVQTSEKGTVPNCEAVNIESKVYFVGVNPVSDPPEGHQVLSLDYSEIATKFDAVPEHIFATHLVDKIIRQKGQVSVEEADASKLWLLRSDGRLVYAAIITSQQVLGFGEWISAAGGLINEIHIDRTKADIRMAILRNGRLRHERQGRNSFFQATVERIADLAGVVRDLGFLEGQTVWAKAEEYILGPFTVEGGKIDLENSYAGTVQVGLFQPPLFESMPRYFITKNDEMIRRPGRIHTVIATVRNTTSIAIGANSGKMVNMPMTKTTDVTDGPLKPKDMVVERNGILGSVTGTTFVISQTKPGELHVRDIEIREKL